MDADAWCGRRRCGLVVARAVQVPLFGAGSQDYGNEDIRFEKLTDGSSDLGNRFSASFYALKILCPGAVDGPLSVPAPAVRPVRSIDPKLQRDITKKIEDHRAKDLALRHKALGKEDRWQISFENHHPSTMAFVSTAPNEASQVPRFLSTGAVALVSGALGLLALRCRPGCTGLTHRNH